MMLNLLILMYFHTVLMLLITSEVSASSLLSDEGSGCLNGTKSLLTKSISSSSSPSSLPSIDHQHRLLFSKQTAFDQDLSVVKKLKPLINDGPYIHFWRPQKVGSSTILAILLSYSYRYNYLPKRKAGANALCREIAQCAISKKSQLHNADDNNNYNNNNSNPWKTVRRMKKQEQQYNNNNSTLTTTEYLRDYIKQSIPGSMNRRSITGRLSRDIKTSMSVPYMMSTAHEICNIHEDVIQQHLLCSFQRGSDRRSDKKKKNRNKNKNGDEGSNDNFLLNPISVLDMITDKKSRSSSSENNEMMKELFLVRDPLSRAISVYYFWGELYKLTRSKHFILDHNRGSKRKLFGSNINDNHDDYYDVDYDGDYDGDGDNNEVTFDTSHDTSHTDDRNDNQNYNNINNLRKHVNNEETEKVKRSLRYRIGENSLTNNRNINHHITSNIIPGQYFRYHGIESTSPPLEYAMQYAKGPIYKAGMPGPSFTWSLFSNSLEGSLDILKSTTRNICAIILERLDESLVVMSYYLKWTLADVVVIKPRKSLSSHPKYKEWPEKSIMKLKKHLMSIGEYDVYNASIEILDQRIKVLEEKEGVNITDEVEKLRLLRKKTTEVWEYILLVVTDDIISTLS